MKFLAIAGIGMLAAASAMAQQAKESVLTLDECIRQALGRSPELEAQRYELKGATAAIWKAQSALFPQVTADLLTQTLNGSPTGPFTLLSIANEDETGTAHGNQRARAHFDAVGTFSVMMSYGLYQNGSILGLNDAPAVASARSDRSRQEWTYRLTEGAVEYKLTTAFYQSVSDQQQLDLAKRKLAFSRERLEIIKAELHVDLKLPKDVEMAQAQVTADQQALVSSEHQAWESGAQLAALLGRRGESISRLDSSEPRIPAAPALPELLKTATRAHPAVGIQQAKIDIAKQNWHLARSDMLPSVKLESGLTGATDFHGTDADLFVVGVRVDVPIFDFGHRQAATRESRNKMLAEQARMGQVEDDLRTSLIAAVGAIHRIESTLANLQRDYIDAKNKATLVQAQRELGMTNRLAVVDAELNLLALSESLNLQKLAQRLQYASLQNATGGFWKWQR